MILLKKRAHLVLETPLSVVRLLPFDVLHQRTQIRRTDGKQTIPTLPCETGHTLFLHPGRGRRLDLRQDLRRVLRRCKSNRKMDMICNSSCPEALAPQFARNPRKIRVQRNGTILRDQRSPTFSAEDDMNQIETQRLRHARDYMSGLQPSTKYPTADLGLRPRLVCHRTYGPPIGARQTTSQNQIRTRGHHA